MAGPCVQDTDSIILEVAGNGDLKSRLRIHADAQSGLRSTSSGVASVLAATGAGWRPGFPSDEETSSFQFAPSQGQVPLFSGVVCAVRLPAATAPRYVCVHYQAGLQLAYTQGGIATSAAKAILKRRIDSGPWETIAEAMVAGPDAKSARWHLSGYEHLLLSDTASHNIQMQLYGEAGAFGSGANVFAQWSGRRSIKVEYA